MHGAAPGRQEAVERRLAQVAGVGASGPWLRRVPGLGRKPTASWLTTRGAAGAQASPGPRTEARPTEAQPTARRRTAPGRTPTPACPRSQSRPLGGRRPAAEARTLPLPVAASCRACGRRRAWSARTALSTLRTDLRRTRQRAPVPTEGRPAGAQRVVRRRGGAPGAAGQDSHRAAARPRAALTAGRTTRASTSWLTPTGCAGPVGPARRSRRRTGTRGCTLLAGGDEGRHREAATAGGGSPPEEASTATTGAGRGRTPSRAPHGGTCPACAALAGEPGTRTRQRTERGPGRTLTRAPEAAGTLPSRVATARTLLRRRLPAPVPRMRPPAPGPAETTVPAVTPPTLPREGTGATPRGVLGEAPTPHTRPATEGHTSRPLLASHRPGRARAPCRRGGDSVWRSSC